MTARHVWLGPLLLAGSCAHAPPCPRGPEDSARRREEGHALVESSREGEYFRTEPFERGMALLREAAAAGDREAQYLVGARRYSLMITSDAPTEGDHQAYLDALTWLILAARRGHPKAIAYFGPDVTPALLDPTRPLGPLGEDTPFPGVPDAWVEEARRRAGGWAACW